ncbi:hypothetical protein H6G80_21610 [Nostoc sp. FACHB-87]|uniref:hypothetical protein n=1 Tax=Nostocaceae TaxID=1162 RepID=UPI00029F1B65|nr:MULTISPECIES: hypothetical protein [Nostocaceae]AFY42470.1 hypothetical protein Nos7107_1837 [Nostoc sp. PCC 7107]MBD2456664.1 hypothetical protein [Nostoc sp. FACHB-87]MBD2478083.1 hypothetical protein [Anabaena sp. FACHB-83]
MGKLIGQTLTVIMFVFGSGTAIVGLTGQQPHIMTGGLVMTATSIRMGKEFFDGVF